MNSTKFPSRRLLFTLPAFVAFIGCNDEPSPTEKIPVAAPKHGTVKPTALKITEAPQPAFHYHFISLRSKNKALRDSSLASLKALSPSDLDIVMRLNRVDAASYRRLDTMIVPDRIDQNWMAYSIFPIELPLLKDVRKMVFFAYYPQAFAAYENGRLVRWGPSNMGKKSSPTPTGLFSGNWKALESTSTVNDEWKLKWNFNVWNKGGVGWHQYQLPGYPASHSCMRLLEADARYLYDWTDQWILSKGQLDAQGTSVIIFGAYPYGHSKPWWSLVANPSALNIPADTMNAVLQPQLARILARQAQRDSVLSQTPKKNALRPS